MKNIFSKISLITLICLFTVSVKGQIATSLYFMEGLPQATTFNPAFDPGYKFYIGLPVINNSYISLSSDIGLGNIYDFNTKTYSWNTPEAYKAFTNNLKKTSYLSTEFNTSLASFGFRIKEKGYFHFSANQRVDIRMGAPRDLFLLNDLTIAHNLSQLETQMQWYSEYGFGYSHKINDKLIVGGKVKYIAGIANATVNFNQFDLNSSNDTWHINMNGSTNISGPINIKTDSNGNYNGTGLAFESISEIINYCFRLANPGFGIDLGVQYEVVPKLKLAASITDLGIISWKRDVANYNLNGNYDFEGVSDLISTTIPDKGYIGLNSNIFGSIVDSISSNIETTKSNNRFSNSLSPKLYVSAEYEFLPTLSVGAVYKSQFIRNRVRQNLLLSANVNLRRILALSANYNFGVGTQSSFGGSLGLKLHPIFIYFAADMVPGYSFKENNSDNDINLPITVPKNFCAANFQFGINIVIGRDKHKKKRQSNAHDKPATYKQPSNIENTSYAITDSLIKDSLAIEINDSITSDSIQSFNLDSLNTNFNIDSINTSDIINNPYKATDSLNVDFKVTPIE